MILVRVNDYLIKIFTETLIEEYFFRLKNYKETITQDRIYLDFKIFIYDFTILVSRIIHNGISSII